MQLREFLVYDTLGIGMAGSSHRVSALSVMNKWHTVVHGPIWFSLVPKNTWLYMLPRTAICLSRTYRWPWQSHSAHQLTEIDSKYNWNFSFVFVATMACSKKNISNPYSKFMCVVRVAYQRIYQKIYIYIYLPCEWMATAEMWHRFAHLRD